MSNSTPTTPTEEILPDSSNQSGKYKPMKHLLNLKRFVYILTTNLMITMVINKCS